MRYILVFLFFIFLGVFSCQNGTNSDAQSIYKVYCVTCHGINGDLHTNGAIDLSQSALPLDERIIVISKGRNIMPTFESTLSPDEIKKVAAYTFMLKSNGHTN